MVCYSIIIVQLLDITWNSRVPVVSVIYKVPVTYVLYEMQIISQIQIICFKQILKFFTESLEIIGIGSFIGFGDFYFQVSEIFFACVGEHRSKLQPADIIKIRESLLIHLLLQDVRCLKPFDSLPFVFYVKSITKMQTVVKFL